MTNHLRCLRARASVRAGLLLCVVALVGLGCASGSVARETELERIRVATATRDVAVDHLNQGRTAMAIRKFHEAHDANPSDAVTTLWLGEAYRRKGMLGKAEEYLLQALALNGDPQDYNYQETVLNLSALYIQMKRFEDARLQCQQLIEDPTFSSPWRALTNKGWAELKLGKLAEARKSFEAAIDFHPRYSPALFNLGIQDQMERRYLSAIRHFDAAIETGRLSADAQAEANYRMAEIYVSLGKRGKAIEHFEVSLERSPYGKWGTQSKSYLELLR